MLRGKPSATRPHHPGRGGKPRGGLGLTHLFLASFALYFLAVGFLFFTYDEGAPPPPGGNRSPPKLERMGNLSVVDALPEKYISFLVCKGYCNQLMAFADGIAMCHLLNATCVLPKWYRHYDYFEPASQTPSILAHSDPQAHYAEDMDYFYDTEYFIQKISGFVRVVSELPTWLQGESAGSYDDLWPVDPARPHTLMPFEQLLRRKNVLRLRCTLHLMVWNTEGMGALRAAIHSALRPGKRLQAVYDSRVAAVAAAMGLSASQPLPYLAVHIRDEADWYKYCREEASNTRVSQISSFEACYQTAVDISHRLVEWGLHKHYKHLYVANGNFSLDQARTMMEIGQFEMLVSEAAMCRRHVGGIQCSHVEVVEGVLEFRAAVDLLMLERSAFFLGNAYSSFSWTVRLARLIKRDSVFTPSDTLYYNMDPSYTASDLQREETLRFTVQGGILHPEWHTEQLPSYYWLHLQHLQGKCLHKHNWGKDCASGTATPPHVASLQITDSGCLDSGYLFVKGHVQPDVVGFNWHPRLMVMVNGRPRVAVTAYVEDEYGSHVHLGQSGFDAEIPIVEKDIARNDTGGWYPAALSVCVSGSLHVCSRESLVGAQIPLRRQDQDTGGIVWLWMPGKYRSGGPEAMHQLHQEVNKWHAEGKIAIRSVFPEGDDFYRGQYSNFVPKFMYSYPGPRDYLVAPEHHSVPVPREFQYVMKEVGTQGLVWHVGQHVTRLAITVRGKESFKPICLSPYFARLLECPEKAIINVPMAEVFLEMGRQEDAHPTKKENIVLFDFDDTAWFDPTRLKLPPGAKLVLMKGLERKEVLALLRKAKVYVDTYLTGNERAVFESTLFNCVPIVANHGPATSWHDFPIHKRYKWQYHDYSQLSETVRFALENHKEALREVRPFRDYIYRMPNLMSENVRTYFQDDVHIVIPLIGEGGRALRNTERFSAFAALLFAVIQYPFATQELVFDNSFYAEFDAAGILYHLHSAGLISSYTGSQVQAEYRRFGPKAVYFQQPFARHYRDFTLIIPPGRMPLHPNLAATMFKAAYGFDYVAVFGPDGVVLADWLKYYDLVNANLWYFDDDFTTRDLQQLLKKLNRPFLVLPRVRELPEDQRQAIPWLTSHSCDVVTLEMFAKPPLSSCFCKDVQKVTSHDLWAGSVNKIPDDDDFRVWMDGIQSHCARHSSNRKHAGHH